MANYGRCRAQARHDAPEQAMPRRVDRGGTPFRHRSRLHNSVTAY
jgi:hypothetical protein